MKLCAICKAVIKEDEHLCAKCQREQAIDQERETYIYK